MAGRLPQCPKCGADVIRPIKAWPFPSRVTRVGEPPGLVGAFSCSRCEFKFRVMMEVAAEATETASDKTMVDRVRVIRGELVQTLRNLREKIKTLETERSHLMFEIDKLREVAESRVNALEGEIKMLREEVESLHGILEYSKKPDEQ